MQVILCIDDHDVLKRARLRDAAPGIWRVRLTLSGTIGLVPPGTIVVRDRRAAELIEFERDVLPGQFAIVVGPLATASMYQRQARVNMLRIAAEAMTK